ncbi:myotubularin-related protein 10-A-like isoform X2 [Lineus longissimus]|uniref:myotubularin-related protein 10-A-like isoform X2 n=1 Tax=Lineus longissimus TaxID=88925 RepID=UPI00315DBB9C
MAHSSKSFKSYIDLGSSSSCPIGRNDIVDDRGRSSFISYIDSDSAKCDSALCAPLRKDAKRNKESFKSYLNLDDVDSRSLTAPDGKEISVPPAYETKLEPDLLPGEVVIAKTTSVLKFSSFTDQKQGIVGSLFCTNFRLSYVTADASLFAMDDGKQRNRLIGEHDIPLMSIDAVYEVSKGKRKKLLPASSIVKRAKHLEIHCKDFRVHSFGFKLASKEEGKVFVNAILCHAYPARLDLLYLFGYNKAVKTRRVNPIASPKRRSDPDQVSQSTVPTFRTIADWEAELSRCNAGKHWRAAWMNQGFRLSNTLPETFVVPKYTSNADLVQVCILFVDSRVPSWCYTYQNGASVVRMANLLPEAEQVEKEQMLINGIDRTCPGKKGVTSHVEDLNKCPPPKDIKTSLEKLKEILSPVSLKDFWTTDRCWLSSLEATKWLSSVSQCLEIAERLATIVVEGNRNVILQEFDGRDYSCVIACLIQILIDVHCRTISGFQSLVQKEWVAMGHKFTQRLGITAKNEQEESPIFLLFLDCVWQLLQQFPSSFEFSETYLTTLWDSAHIGLFGNFLFDCVHTSSKLCKEQLKLESVWNWHVQFSDKDLALFKNPLFLAKNSEELSTMNKKLAAITNSLNNDNFKKKLYLLYLNREATEHGVVLKPQVIAPMLKLWSQCYLRWSSPVEIYGGGAPSEYFQQCVLVEEVLCLKHKLANLEKASASDANKRYQNTPKSELFFSFNTQQTPRSSKMYSDVLTSSFPFSPGGLNKSNAGTPLSLYLEGSEFGPINLNDSEDLSGSYLDD